MFLTVARGGACALGLGLAVLGTALPVSAATFAPTDLAKLVSLSNATIASDGRHAAVVVRRVDLESNTRSSDIDLYDLPSGARRQVTFDRKGVGALAFSPDGRSLAFLASDATSGKDGNTQIYVLPLDGGDAKKVSSFESDVDQFAWRPDGSAFAVVASEEPPKREGLARFHDAFEVGNNSYLAREAAQPEHVYLQPRDGSKATQLTTGTASVTSGEAEDSLAWSSDGASLYYTQAPDNVLDDAARARVVRLDVASKVVTPLTARDTREGNSAVAPGGALVAYTWSPGDSQVSLVKPYVVPAGTTGDGTLAVRDFDRAVINFGWRDAHTLLLAANDGVHHRWYTAPVGGTPTPLDLGGIEATSSFAGAVANDGSIVFVGSTPERPPELYLLPRGGAPKRLSDYNSTVASLSLASRRELAYDGPDGFKEDAAVLYPPGFASGTKYPTVLLVHGGPTAASTLGFDSLGNALAARGWIVLEPNYRGSDNLGLAYQRAVFDDAQDGPARDVMAALAALEKTGVVDESRLGVSGWSYGGIMTSWLVEKYHVWKAGLTGAAVNDWSVDYAIADDLTSDREIFPGSPFVGDGRADYLKQSSITYAKEMTTPLLIVHDVGDARDPIVNSYLFYHAIKDNGAPVTFVAYPVNGHFPPDPGHQIDLCQRWIDWFASHF
jgi:dipeptidyl aminopeptidase/acylaminoacyl peptidase